MVGRLDLPSAVGRELVPHDPGLANQHIPSPCGSDWFREGHVTSEGVVRVHLRTSANKAHWHKDLSFALFLSEGLYPGEQLEALYHQRVGQGLPQMK